MIEKIELFNLLIKGVIKLQNEGKKFETDFIRSVPKDWFHYRLNDSSSSWSSGEKARFTPSNICDFIVYNSTLWLLELKSHKGKSIPFSCIRPKQVEGLMDAYTKKVNAGYIINFRDIEETYFVYADAIHVFMKNETRKSIPLIWIKETGVLIPQTKKKVRYNYDLKFMEN